MARQVRKPNALTATHTRYAHRRALRELDDEILRGYAIDGDNDSFTELMRRHEGIITLSAQRALSKLTRRQRAKVTLDEARDLVKIYAFQNMDRRRELPFRHVAFWYAPHWVYRELRALTDPAWIPDNVNSDLRSGDNVQKKTKSQADIDRARVIRGARTLDYISPTGDVRSRVDDADAESITMSEVPRNEDEWAETLDGNSAATRLKRRLSAFSDDDREVMALYFGFDGPPRTTAEIAVLRGTTHQAVSQRIRKVCKQLRRPDENGIDPIERMLNISA